MSQTSIDVDDAALAVVGVLLGTTSTEDTVNAALHEVIAQRKRLAMLERMMIRSREKVDQAPDPWRKTATWR
ncbi:type II toxin-antitoxin system VapB family antitoxin [Nocardia sp. bgisy134]|uniref:type II toxin-antitoxin system VapB family antitoxin n=1 Tax=unclassified Nocardia TaxID=2637762 RepID=UPI003D74D330